MHKITIRLLLIALVCTGCSTLTPTPTPTNGLTTNPGNQAQAEPTVPQGQRLNPIAIVSDNTPNAQAIEGALRQRLARANGGPGYLRYLTANADPAVINALITDLALDRVITIGPQATAAIKPTSKRTVVFAGVEHAGEFLNQGYLGVASVPSLVLQLQAWQAARPAIANLGTLVSRDFSHQLQELMVAASHLGLTVHAEIVASDREASYVLQDIAPIIDAWIYLPDPKILSPDFIRSAYEISTRQNLAQLAYTPAILNLPGVDGVAADPEDVAQQATRLLALTINPEGSRQRAPGFRALGRAQLIPSGQPHQLAVVLPGGEVGQ